MNNSEKLKYVADYAYINLLKPLGYKRRQNTFNKTTEEGIKHVINFQAYPYEFDSPETRKMKEQVFGDMPSYGEFTINLGIWVPGIDEFLFKFNKTKSDFVVAAKCHIRSRIKNTEGDKEIWYSLEGGLDATGVEVIRIIEEQGLDLFSRFSTIEQVLSYLENQTSNTSIVATPLLLASLIHLSIGDKSKAKRLFSKHYDLSEHKGHKEHLQKIANELGFKVN